MVRSTRSTPMLKTRLQIPTTCENLTTRSSRLSRPLSHPARRCTTQCEKSASRTTTTEPGRSQSSRARAQAMARTSSTIDWASSSRTPAGRLLHRLRPDTQDGLGQTYLLTSLALDVRPLRPRDKHPRCCPLRVDATDHQRHHGEGRYHDEVATSRGDVLASSRRSGVPVSISEGDNFHRTSLGTPQDLCHPHEFKPTATILSIAHSLPSYPLRLWYHESSRHQHPLLALSSLPRQLLSPSSLPHR